MADRTLRGARIGFTSLQGEEGIEFSPRQAVEYRTEQGRAFQVLFDADAQPPEEWKDQRSGETGYLSPDAGAAAKEEQEIKSAAQRTHWDMLLERRSREELEELLDERLRLLRERRGTAAAAAAKKR